MKEITIDFKILDNKEKFYDYISEEMDFPQWFGRNADALNDLLDCEADVHITVKNSASAGDWATPIISVFSHLKCVEFAKERTLPSIENMKRSDFYYDLPEELIAQTPIEPRNHSWPSASPPAWRKTPWRRPGRRASRWDLSGPLPSGPSPRRP